MVMASELLNEEEGFGLILPRLWSRGNKLPLASSLPLSHQVRKPALTGFRAFQRAQRDDLQHISTYLQYLPMQSQTHALLAAAARQGCRDPG